nr:ComEC/Rec2 family competence protein [Desulforamulus aquiferis]
MGPFCACAALGCLLASWHLAQIVDFEEFNGQKVKLLGVVMDYPDIRPDGVFYKIRLNNLVAGQKTIEKECLLRVKMPQDKVFKYGSILKLQGKLSIPDPPGNPGAFDYGKWLLKQGISATINVKEISDVTLMGQGGNFAVIWAHRLRESLEQIFDKTMPQVQASVIKGIIFGTRGEIPWDVQLAFNSTGLVHILSVSGYHVGLVVALVLILIRLLKIPQGCIAFTAIPLIFFYALMTGLGPPVFRAAAMASLLLLAHHLGREQDWPTTLVLAGGILLAIKPMSLFDIGFQLSFIATWGLLYITPS